MDFKPENLHIWSADWFMKEGDYRAVEMVGHSTYATYEMQGRKLRARFEYNGNGVGGQIYFEIDGDVFGRKHAEAKKHLGFSPLPSSQDQVQNLQFWDYDRYGSFGSGRKRTSSLMQQI